MRRARPRAGDLGCGLGELRAERREGLPAVVGRAPCLGVSSRRAGRSRRGAWTRDGAARRFREPTEMIPGRAVARRLPIPRRADHQRSAPWRADAACRGRRGIASAPASIGGPSAGGLIRRWRRPDLTQQASRGLRGGRRHRGCRRRRDVTHNGVTGHVPCTRPGLPSQPRSARCIERRVQVRTGATDQDRHEVAGDRVQVRSGSTAATAGSRPRRRDEERITPVAGCAVLPGGAGRQFRAALATTRATKREVICQGTVDVVLIARPRRSIRDLGAATASIGGARTI